MMKYVTIMLLIILGSGCSRKSSTSSHPDPVSQREYHGNAVTTIRYYEFNPELNEDVFNEEIVYTFDVWVYTDRPLETENYAENNPIYLSLYADRLGREDVDGYVDLSSAAILNDIIVGEVLLQYWDLEMNGTSINGVLADTHIAEGAAANILWAYEEIYSGFFMTWPFPIAAGATLSGTVTENAVTLVITGESHDTYREFSCVVEAWEPLSAVRDPMGADLWFK